MARIFELARYFWNKESLSLNSNTHELRFYASALIDIEVVVWYILLYKSPCIYKCILQPLKQALQQPMPMFQNAKNTDLGNYCFQPVAIETTGVYGKSTAPFFSCFAKKLVDMWSDPRQWQWSHQCLSLAVVRRNAARILTLCKFGMILVIPSALTSVAVCQLPSFNE